MSNFVSHSLRRVFAFLLTVAVLATTAVAEDAGGAGHGGHASDDPGHMNANAGLESPAEWSTQLAVYTFVVFWLLLAILAKAAWPKISSALVEREKHIEGQIAAAEGKHEEAKRLLAEHEARLASTADEVRAMLEEARRDAEATKEQIVAEARTAAEQEQQRGIREIELAADQAMKNLAEHSANLAIQMAGKVIGENISADRQAALVRESLAQLASNN
ncbi:F0F1 ATP synthase subunit B [Adhaeretor mobilis]|uniref:ATP synthase subunit b n=1 Tax=Adhaeretor mobilis TaxID=1930276 RepID=A0A517MXU0_9BACT|nr:F0F1 ATP synthase subunit B [Adhaeretor mobilis]QDS99689.1 ATP synthase subunit b precursor [Adhaeretor mobilis]